MATRITLGNLVIDRDAYEVWVNGDRMDLTYVEFEVLHHLARNAGKVVLRDRLLGAVWGEGPRDHARKLTVHISRLRKKIRDSRPWRIQTVTKRGYALATASAEPRTAISGGRPLTPSPSSRGLVGG